MKIILVTIFLSALAGCSSFKLPSFAVCTESKECSFTVTMPRAAASAASAVK